MTQERQTNCNKTNCSLVGFGVQLVGPHPAGGQDGSFQAGQVGHGLPSTRGKERANGLVYCTIAIEYNIGANTAQAHCRPLRSTASTGRPAASSHGDTTQPTLQPVAARASPSAAFSISSFCFTDCKKGKGNTNRCGSAGRQPPLRMDRLSNL